MDTRELRIGNRLKISGYDKIYKVTFFGYDRHNLPYIQLDHFLTRPIEELEPIVLTPQLLRAYGFDQNNRHKIVQVFRYKDALLHITNWLGNDVFWRAPCQHLHQLQNLYFALTGKELEQNL